MKNRKKSWADVTGIPRSAIGKYVNKIPIREKNRVTKWQFRKDGIQSLVSILASYTTKGICAEIVGIQYASGVKYAIFVESKYIHGT